MTEPRAAIPDQRGKTVLITGANSGLGLHSARALAAAGARVLMACRDRHRAAHALDDVAACATGPKPLLLQLDLGDLASVRQCAEQVLDGEFVIDVLMLNAGVMAMPRSLTTDGFEIHLGTNHLGHFAFAGLVIPCVLAAPAPRVVVTSSLAHWAGYMRWDDLNWSRRFYSASLAYGQSKLANLLFTLELSRRARSSRSDLVAVAAHPGSAHTNLATQNENAVIQALYRLLRKYTTQPAAQGALPQLHAATKSGINPGTFWGPDGPLELHGAPAPANLARRARDANDAQRLWQCSERLTGVTWPDPLGSLPAV